MAYMWACTCGERWPQWLVEIPRHVKEGRERGEDHHLLGLIDEETGDVVAGTMRQARDLGFVPPSRKKKAGRRRGTDDGDGPVAGATGTSATIRGRFVTQEVLLDGRLLSLYDLAKLKYPEYDAAVGEWIWDCIAQFYAEHSEELGLGALFADTFKVEEAAHVE